MGSAPASHNDISIRDCCNGEAGKDLFNTFIFILFLLQCLVASNSYGGNSDSWPWEFRRNEKAETYSFAAGTPPEKTLTRILAAVFRAVSAVDGDRCPMVPTCSTYSLQSIEKHGIFIGWIMTADRLIREMEEQDRASLVARGDGYHRWDPVTANDSWWCPSGRLDK